MPEKPATISEKYFDYFEGFISFLIDPNDRLFIVYLLSSLAIVYFLYRKSKSDEGLLSFIFPKSVWNHPSAWLDVRYFFFHGMIGKFIVHILTAGAFIIGVSLTVNLETLDNLIEPSNFTLIYRSAMAITAFIIMALISDFVAFYLHYLQHKIPLLWQFHKIHHSSEVMHPLSNFREHPVDNLTYDFIIQFVNGIASGLILNILGFSPDAIQIFGLGILALLFNLIGYQLRHSHIWLRWPGIWSKVFPSPAHHQIHHSRHPDHLDKNFAFMFPIWDVLFNTYEMPEDNRDVEFGIVEDSSELNSCLNLYFIPFRDAYRLFKNEKKTEPSLILPAVTHPEKSGLNP